jgi:tetratricopeptide (TPR) repeat protein
MKRWISLLILAMALTARADSALDAKAQLRKLCQLPSLSLTFAFRIDPKEGIQFAENDQARDETIAALEKGMRNEPSDAEHYLHLARLYARRKNGQADAKRTREKAIELFRKRVESHPEDGPLLAALAGALMESDIDEAERVVRRGVKVAPGDWHCWSCLGDILVSQAFSALYKKDADESPNALEMFKRVAQNKPAPAQLEASQKKLDEGMACLNKAVSLAPKEPGVYEKRGADRCSASLLDMLKGAALGKEVNPLKLTTVYFSGDGENDFKTVARLSPTNYHALGSIVLFEAVREALSHGDDSGFSGHWSGYSEKSQKTVREAMTGLNKLADHPDKHLASQALLIEGVMQEVIIGDLSASEKSLRQAVLLNPQRSETWEMLDTIFITEKHYDDLASACEARLKYETTPRTLFLLAKARDELNQADKVEQLLQKMLELSPEDFNANFGMAVILLRRTDSHSIIRSTGLLEHASAILDQAPVNEETEQQRLKVYFTSGLYYGLIDLNDKARKVFQDILNHDKNNEDAKAALAAIGN